MLYRDPLVAFWTGPWSPAAVQTWAADMATRWNVEGVGKWLARSGSDAALVGRGGFIHLNLHGESVLELGWVVRDALTGRGYATETAGPLLIGPRAANADRRLHRGAQPPVAAGDATPRDAQGPRTRRTCVNSIVFPPEGFRPRAPASLSVRRVCCAAPVRPLILA